MEALAERLLGMQLKLLRPRMQSLILNALQALDRPEIPATADTPAQIPARLCGRCLAGALNIISESCYDYMIDFEESTLKKGELCMDQPIPGMTLTATMEADHKFWTALLRFVAKPRSDEAMESIMRRLNDNSVCPCIDPEDPDDVDEFSSPFTEPMPAHYLADIGLVVAKNYYSSGAILRLPVRPYYRLPFSGSPRMPPSLRGRGTSSWTDRAPYGQLPPAASYNRIDFIPYSSIFFNSLLTQLSSILSTRTSISFAKGRSQFWPFSPRDFLLLLQGELTPDDTSAPDSDVISACGDMLVRSSEHWLLRLEDPIVTTFMTIVVGICGSLIMPAIAARPLSSHILPILTRNRVLLVMQKLREIDNLEPSYTHFVARKAVGEWVAIHLLDVTSHFAMLGFREDFPSTFEDLIPFSICIKLAQLFTITMYLLEDTRIPLANKNTKRWKEVKAENERLCLTYNLKVLSRFAPFNRLPQTRQLCHPRLAEQLNGIMGNYRTLSKSGIKEGWSPATSRQLFLRDLTMLRRRSYCFTVGCQQSIQGIGRQFKSCGGCRIAKYCGRECQKSDWKGLDTSGRRVCEKGVGGGDLRHSYICGLLGKFVTADSDKETFAHEVEQHDQDWHSLCIWSKSRILPETRSKEPEAVDFEDLEIPDDLLDEFEVFRGWEDFEDILQEFVLLGQAPKPITPALWSI